MKRLLMLFLLIGGVTLLLLAALLIPLRYSAASLDWFYYQDYKSYTDEGLFRLENRLDLIQPVASLLRSQSNFYTISPDHRGLILQQAESRTQTINPGYAIYRLSPNGCQRQDLMPLAHDPLRIITWWDEWLVFERSTPTAKMIYKVREDGRYRQELLSLPLETYRYEWTGDGTWLFWRNLSLPQAANTWEGLHVPSGRRAIFGTDLQNPQWLQTAANHQALYFRDSFDQQSAIYRVSLVDGRSTQLSPLTSDPLSFLGESSDSQWLYYRMATGTQTTAYRVATDGTSSPLPISQNATIYGVAFFDDPDWALWMMDDGDGLDAGLYRGRFDASDLTLLSNSPSHRWSKDHQWLVFTQDEAFVRINARGQIQRWPTGKRVTGLEWRLLDEWILYEEADQVIALKFQTGELQALQGQHSLYDFFEVWSYPVHPPYRLVVVGLAMLSVWAFFTYKPPHAHTE